MPWEHAASFIPETLYLNTASMGLPPAVTRVALQRDLQRWSTGRAHPGDYDDVVTRARERYARLVHVDPSDVTVGHQVSPLVGLVAAAVPDGAEIVTAEGEFTSLTFPFAAHAKRGVHLREVPLDHVAAATGPDTTWVAVSAVQSADGRLADLDGIEAAARRNGARTLIDLTQAAGWLEIDARRFDATVCAAYKWLLSPRGSAFMTASLGVADELTPLAANWFAGHDVWSSIYGLPLRLASDARRFDVSPAWAPWVGTDASLGFLLDVGIGELHEHALAVSRAFASAAGLPDPMSAIVSLDAVPGQADRMAEVVSEFRAATSLRAGRVRLSFHVHNTTSEVEPFGEALRGLVTA